MVEGKGDDFGGGKCAVDAGASEGRGDGGCAIKNKAK